MRNIKADSHRYGFVRAALLWLLLWGSVGGFFLFKAAPTSDDVSGDAGPASSLAWAGPPVACPAPTKSIEEVRVGDYVMAKDPSASGPPTPHRVTAISRHWTDHLVHIALMGGGELTATREHPFWVPGRGWVYAKDLRTGNPLVDNRGSRAAVSDLRT